MGNKPHRLSRLTFKEIRRSTQKEITKKQEQSIRKTHTRTTHIKPFNHTTAKTMLKHFKNNVEHMHLKTKAHHSKRTTPGSLDAESPTTMKNYHRSEKSHNITQEANIQKSMDLWRKYYRRAA